MDRETRLLASLSRTIGLTLTVLATAAIALAVASFSIAGRVYGYGLFVGVPFFVGFFSVAIYRLTGPRSLSRCLAVATATALVLALGFLLFGMDGLICIIIAAPLGLPSVLIGACWAYLVLHRTKRTSPLIAAGLVLLAMWGGLAIERGATFAAPVYVVQDAVDIAAPVDRVWDTILALGELPPARDWLLRSGVACPQRVAMLGRGVGAHRICTLSTGAMDERITAWEPGRRLSWDVLATPPPLREINPLAASDPPHLHGFYKSLRGEFEMVPSGAGHARVWRRTWYQHNLYPAAYWRLWCDLIARRAHQYVLEQVKVVAEDLSARAE